MDLTFNPDNTVSMNPIPKKGKKLTGTRFASIFGLNTWNTPFQMWCEITKAYQAPFEETKYTTAGKKLEPKQIQYMRDAYGMSDLIDPTQEYGEDYFKKTWGDFFPEDDVLGGMWDAIIRDEDTGDVESVLEFKTTKRAEDWKDADGNIEPPEYYAMQAALYAYLLGCDDIIMVVTFLEEDDYDHIDDFKVSVKNTSVYEFSLSERYPNFEDDFVIPAREWYEEHVFGGTSPEFDERYDKDYLKAMRTTVVSTDSDVEALLNELADCHEEIAAANASVADAVAKEKKLKEALKKHAEKSIGKKSFAEFGNDRVTCKLSKSTKTEFDEDAMKNDGVYDDYVIETESTRFTVSYPTKK